MGNNKHIPPSRAHKSYRWQGANITKKAKQGRCKMECYKIILGFELDSTNCTVKSPDAKLQKIISTSMPPSSLQERHCVYIKNIGQMRHLASIAPAVLGLFAPLNKGDQVQVGLGKRSDTRVIMTDMV
eukprot:15366251-Ditylum_brightwellii.AAC.4